MSTDELILPEDGYEAFLHFLYEVPSQPALLDRKRKKASASLDSLFVSFEGKTPAPKTKKYSFRNADKEKEWELNYQALREYHADNGNCDVPFGKETGSLRSWTERQRRLHARGELDQEKVDELNALEFDFTVRQLSTRSVAKSSRSVGTSSRSEGTSARPVGASTRSVGASSSRALKDAEKAQSSQNQSSAVKPKPVQPATKPPVQRKSSASMKDEQVWNKSFEELKAFHAKTGSCEVPFGADTGGLRSWTERQRKLHNINRLDQARAEKLTELGFVF